MITLRVRGCNGYGKKLCSRGSNGGSTNSPPGNYKKWGTPGVVPVKSLSSVKKEKAFFAGEGLCVDVVYYVC